MASARIRSELQALVFDPQYIQFKPKGAGVTLYFTPEFMRKNQRPNQVNDPWYIPVVLTDKPDFGTPNCPVRALRGTCTATRPSQASPRKAEPTVTPAQDLEAFKADMTSMLSDMLQASLSKFASQFNPSSGGQGDTAPAQTAQTVASEPTVDVASNDDDSPHRGPEDQSKGEVTDSEGEPADPTATGLPTLEQLKMSEEEQREFDAFSLASVSVPTSSKRPWRALGDSKDSQSQPQDDSNVRQARPQAVAKAQ